MTREKAIEHLVHWKSLYKESRSERSRLMKDAWESHISNDRYNEIPNDKYADGTALKLYREAIDSFLTLFHVGGHSSA